MVIYKNVTDKITVGEAIAKHEEEGMATQVNDGKDIVLVTDRKRPVLLHYI